MYIMRVLILQALCPINLKLFVAIEMGACNIKFSWLMYGECVCVYVCVCVCVCVL
jgi:hypothetical protein